MLPSVVVPRRNPLIRGVYAAGVLLLSATPLAAADKTMAVDWSSEEIGAFLRERAAAAPTPRSAEDSKLDALKLPVLGFDRPPATVTNALAATARPELKRKVIMDEKNPVWYQIVDRYGDMVIKVEADLRIHQELPADTPVYGGGGPGASPQSSISVFDGRAEPGMEGAIAEYTVYKFPSIPYKVSIECPAGNTQSCRDLDTIAKDQAQLKVIAADPPRP